MRVFLQRSVSRAARLLTECRIGWVKNGLIRFFLLIYRPDMEEAQESAIATYANFNEFFSRPLKPESRPIMQNPWVCPADATLMQGGDVEEGRIINVKGRSYGVHELLDMPPGETAVRKLSRGFFAVFYLSPRDYHRVHSPCAASLRSCSFIPGSLFPVNAPAARRIPDLYARNQRLVFLFDAPVGIAALVMVGALFVSTISTPWGLSHRADHNEKKVHRQERAIAKGEEIGRFLMGSSIVLLMERRPTGRLPRTGARVRMGEALFASY